MKPRFFEARGGEIIDLFTGLTIARIAIENLNTASAGRVSAAIISALHAEFGPKGAQEVT